MIERLKQLEELTESSEFVITLSTYNEGKIETQCITNNFKIGDLPIAGFEAKSNIESIYNEHHRKAELASSAS